VPGASAKTLAGDIWRLPAGCGLVVRQSVKPGGPVDLAAVLKQAGQLPGGMNPDAMVAQATKMAIKAAEMTGNVRFDAATVGVSGNVGDNTGFGAVIVRGQYDAKVISALIREQGDCKSEKVNGIDVLKLDDEVAMILPLFMLQFSLDEPADPPGDVRIDPLQPGPFDRN